MKTDLEKQIELLTKYGITNYTITDNIITVNGSVDLELLTSIEDKDFLSNVVINGTLYLNSLTSVPHKDFLSNVVINGTLYLSSLTSVPHKDFLSNTVINGTLYLSSLTSVPKDFLSNTVIGGSIYLNLLKKVPDKDFLSNTVINGSLYLYSLTSVPDKDFLSNTVINGNLNLSSLTKNNDKRLLRNNVKQLQVGYNEEKKYCFFDRILSKVITVSERKGYVIYTTPSGYITQKGNFTAHGKTIKKAIEDLEFKIISEKLKKEPIYPDTVFTVQYYRTLTGACEQGCKQWLSANNMNDVDTILAKDLLTILETTKAYGLDKFKQLITF
jgi:hypothetical protein